MKYVAILFINLIGYIAAHAQLTIIHSCSNPYYTAITTEEFNTYDVVINNYTECGHEYTYTIDVNTRTVPDNFIIFEVINGIPVKKFETGWIGSKNFFPFDSSIVGYTEYVDGVITKLNYSCSSIPLDFPFYPVYGCEGFSRIIFHSTSKKIIFRIILNSTDYSFAEFYIHCNKSMIPLQVIHTEEYMCYIPIVSRVEYYNEDCSKKFIIDSIYVGEYGELYDTLYLLKDREHIIRPIADSTFLWTNGDRASKNIYVDRELFLPGTVINEYGCEVDAGIRIIPYTLKIYIPNIFSPNGDGINDVFQVQALDGTFVKELRIYDRWGSMVFNGEVWDGGNCNPGVYTYIAIVENSGGQEKYMGDVTLVR